MNIITKETKDKGNTPKDIIMIKKLIENEGIQEYEKNCINYLSDFLNGYITSTLEDSLFYAKMCGRNKPNLEDVKLAVKFKKENNFSKKPSNSVLKATSNLINSKALPSIPQGTCTLNLPLVESTQLKNNFQIYSEDVVNNMEKNSNTVDNWFFSSKIENVTRIKQKGLSLSKKKMNIAKPKPEIKENNPHSEIPNLENINNFNKNELNNLNLKEDNYNQEENPEQEYDYDN